MLAHTKKHPIDSAKFYGSQKDINRLRDFAKSNGLIEVSPDSIPAAEICPALETNPSGVYMKGIRYREDLTQAKLSILTGISKRNISEMENGKRPVDRETANKLAKVLNADPKILLSK